MNGGANSSWADNVSKGMDFAGTIEQDSALKYIGGGPCRSRVARRAGGWMAGPIVLGKQQQQGHGLCRHPFTLDGIAH